MAALRIIFMGTPELAAASLAALLREPAFQILAAVTQPDRPKGRDLKLQPSPVKQLALTAGLPVLQPEKARDEKFIAELRAWRPTSSPWPRSDRFCQRQFWNCRASAA